jgi:hypothetical protein
MGPGVNGFLRLYEAFMTSRRLQVIQKKDFLTRPEKVHKKHCIKKGECTYKDHFDHERTGREGEAGYAANIATHCSGSMYSRCCTSQRPLCSLVAMMCPERRYTKE